MNTFGKNVKISLFGEIYNKCIGLTIDGIPPGCPVNLNKLRKEIKAIYDKDKSLFKLYFEEYKILVPLKFLIFCNQFFQEIYLSSFVNYVFSFLKNFLFIFDQ